MGADAEAAALPERDAPYGVGGRVHTGKRKRRRSQWSGSGVRKQACERRQCVRPSRPAALGALGGAGDDDDDDAWLCREAGAYGPRESRVGASLARWHKRTPSGARAREITPPPASWQRRAPPWQVASGSVAGTSFTLKGLSERGVYRFQLRAHNAKGWSVAGKLTEPLTMPACGAARPQPPSGRPELTQLGACSASVPATTSSVSTDVAGS